MATRARVFFLSGAWHGSWCWTRHVTPLLTKLRYECIPIDYPRTFHPDAPSNFDRYVNCTLDKIEQEHKQDTSVPNVIVCHSFGGLIGTNVTEKAIQERNVDIEGVVHISSMALLNNEDFVSAVIQNPLINFSLPEQSQDIHMLHDGKWSQLQPERAKMRFYHDCKEEDVEYALAHLVPEMELNESCVARYTDDGYGKVTKLYVETTDDRKLSIDYQREVWNKLKLRREKYEVITMDTSHSPFFAQPITLVAHLNEWMVSKTKLRL